MLALEPKERERLLAATTPVSLESETDPPQAREGASTPSTFPTTPSCRCYSPWATAAPSRPPTSATRGSSAPPVFLGVDTLGARECYQVEVPGQARAMDVATFVKAAGRDPLRRPRPAFHPGSVHPGRPADGLRRPPLHPGTVQPLAAPDPRPGGRSRVSLDAGVPRPDARRPPRLGVGGGRRPPERRAHQLLPRPGDHPRSGGSGERRLRVLRHHPQRVSNGSSHSPGDRTGIYG